MPKRKIRWTNCTPDPVTSSPYSYGAKDPGCGEEDVFKKDDIAQATTCELSTLFSGRSKEKEPTKKWFTTQLEFYGIPFKKTASRPALREALELAFDAGKCEDLTPPIAAIRDGLRKRYDDAWKYIEDKQFAKMNGDIQQEADCDPPRFVAKYFLDDRGRPDRRKTKDALSFRIWNNVNELRGLVAEIPGLKLIEAPRRVLIGWDETIQRGIETELRRIASSLPSLEDKPQMQAEQANIDLKLFLDRHLHIDPEGRPTKAGPKPSTPVLFLHQYLANRELPNHLVAKAPGLKLKRHYAICVIGWDAGRVDAEIARMKAEEKRREEEEEARAKLAKAKALEEKRALWHERCKPHRDFVAKIKRNPPKAFGLQLLVGRYLVRREAEEDKTGPSFVGPGWAGCDWTGSHNLWEEFDEMQLNIFPPERNRKSHGLKASFSFGNIEGTMLLAMSRDKVVLLREAQPKDWGDDSPASGVEDEELDDEAGTVGSSYVQTSVDVGFVSFPTVSRSLGGASGGNRLGSFAAASSASAGTKRPAPGESNVADPFGVLAARAKRQRMMEEQAVASKAIGDSVKREVVKQEQPDSINLAALSATPRPGTKKEVVTETNTRTRSSIAAALPATQQQPSRYRVFFQLAYNMVDGYPDVDEKNRQIGHFDFDEYATTADGVFRAPDLSDKVQRLTIFKVSDQPNSDEQPIEWLMFDGRRWGGF